jgi:hypothetical protein
MLHNAGDGLDAFARLETSEQKFQLTSDNLLLLHRQTNLASSCIAGFCPGSRALAYRVLKGATISWRVPKGATIVWFVSKSETFVWSKRTQNHVGRGAALRVPCAVRRHWRRANSLRSTMRAFSPASASLLGHATGQVFTLHKSGKFDLTSWSGR